MRLLKAGRAALAALSLLAVLIAAAVLLAPCRRAAAGDIEVRYVDDEEKLSLYSGGTYEEVVSWAGVSVVFSVPDGLKAGGAARVKVRTLNTQGREKQGYTIELSLPPGTELVPLFSLVAGDPDLWSGVLFLPPVEASGGRLALEAWRYGDGDVEAAYALVFREPGRHRVEVRVLKGVAVVKEEAVEIDAPAPPFWQTFGWKCNLKPGRMSARLKSTAPTEEEARRDMEQLAASGERHTVVFYSEGGVRLSAPGEHELPLDGREIAAEVSFDSAFPVGKAGARFNVYKIAERDTEEDSRIAPSLTLNAGPEVELTTVSSLSPAGRGLAWGAPAGALALLVLFFVLLARRKEVDVSLEAEGSVAVLRRGKLGPRGKVTAVLTLDKREAARVGLDRGETVRIQVHGSGPARVETPGYRNVSEKTGAEFPGPEKGV